MTAALALLLALAAPGPAASSARSARSQALLLADHAVVAPGGEFRLGLALRPDRGWHTYWKNPGDSGAAPILKWRLPKGVELGEPEWQVPERLPVGPLVNYGYDGESFMIFPARLATDEPGPLTIGLDAEWLVCKEECVPASAKLSLTLRPGERPRRDAAWRAVERRHAEDRPRPGRDLEAAARRAGDELFLRFRLPVGSPAPKSAWFFADESLVVDHAAPQPLTREGDSYELSLPPAPEAAVPPSRLSGLLVLDGLGYEISAGVAASSTGLWAALALAFAGGLLLNLMPCVFPVLSIKVLGMLQHGRMNARRHGLAYSAGVVASFWLLAGLLLALRARGQALGWGFQLQSPVFLGALALLFVVLAASMLGFFEVGARLTRLGRLTSGEEGLRGSFLSGALAVVVATPCTAPFMGAALGAALALPAPQALAVFTSLALGMALPYQALVSYPPALRLLPRPGAWMDRLKKALAVPLLATAAWLLWVLGLQLGAPWAARPAGGLDWKKWSAEAVAGELAAGREVFVDFTAAWCVTCQVNERVALAAPEARAALSRPGLTLMKADWTSYDPEITQALARLGRSGVPVYVLHRPGRAPDVWPAVLTPSLVVERLAPKK